MAVEIERKWMINAASIPDFEFDTIQKIRQAYLVDKEKHIIRVRTSYVSDPRNRVVQNYHVSTLTVKGPSGGKYAQEFEMSIPYEYAETFMLHAPVLEKIRKTVIIGNDINIEIDFFTSPALLGLIVAEVEFESNDMADHFLVPRWFGEEVTFDREYSNANLYRKVGG